MPRPQQDENTSRIIAQALLPGLEIAYQEIGNKILQCKMLLGIPQGVSESFVAQAAQEPPPPEEEVPVRRFQGQTNSLDTCLRELVSYGRQHQGQIRTNNFFPRYMEKHGLDRSRANGAVYGAIAKLTKQGFLRRIGSGEYVLTSKAGQPATGLAPAKKKLSAVAKKRWDTRTKADKKRWQEAMQRGKAKAEQARRKATKQAVEQATAEEAQAS